MNKAILLWAILMTFLSGLFVWRYEQKSCIENKVVNIVDTALIYIPMDAGYLDNSGLPGLKMPKLPSVVQSGRQKRFVIMPTVTLGLNDKLGGVSMGLTGMYLRDRWTYICDQARKLSETALATQQGFTHARKCGNF